MKRLFTIPDAVILAEECHRGQFDKGGLPYITHPMRVWRALWGQPDCVQMAGLLHDVIEDSGMTYQSLRARGVPMDAAGIVVDVSRRPQETYHEFIDRITTPEAIIVKLADIADNLDPVRADQLEANKRATLWQRYNEAQLILLKRQGERRIQSI